MKNVSILVPESSVMQAIADPQYLFSAANQFLMAAGKPPLFKVELVGAKKEVKLSDGMFSVHTDRQLKDVKKTDLVLIPALFGDMQTAIDKNKTLLPWINEQYKKGAEVASLCVGAFLLASTGLLNGKKCSTHWGFQNEFRQMFPEVEVMDGSIITEEPPYWLQNILPLILTETARRLSPCSVDKKTIRMRPSKKHRSLLNSTPQKKSPWMNWQI
jgi:transcriptional regulator GlxA family with amidase domain